MTGNCRKPTAHEPNVRVPAIQEPEHTQTSRLRLNSHDSGTETGPNMDAAANVGADIKAEISRSNELSIEARHSPEM